MAALLLEPLGLFYSSVKSSLPIGASVQKGMVDYGRWPKNRL